ncbi:MAG: hypothetical protein HZA50_14570 [Planctomycetes bacterium]|nr:hypothetical protein [Planctomycetota bacterium]
MKTYKCGRNIAEVMTWYGESAITVHVENQLVFRQTYIVNDNGGNGSYVMDAAWSPNGTYFAFKVTSAGGHMPYRSPVHILRVNGTKWQSDTIDAETIIRKIPGMSNIAVSHEQKPYIKWLSDTKLQVSVMAHDEQEDAGMYVIDLETMTAAKAH